VQQLRPAKLLECLAGLKLLNFGFERNRSFGFALSSVSLQLAQDGGDEDAVFGNPFVIVKLSNVYSENTGMYTSL
jgi:hypothetical protein